MKNIIEYLERIERVEGNNAKKALLQEMLESINISEQFFKLVHNEDKYGLSTTTIVKVLENVTNRKLDIGKYEDAGEMAFEEIENRSDTNINFGEILELIDCLKNTSGNKLIELLTESYSELNHIESKWLTRILLKNLRIGITLTTINKVFKELGIETITRFEVQLCGKLTDVNDWNIFPCYVSTKYDGFRCIVEKIDDKVTMTSRAGKQVNSFLPELVEEFKKIKADFVLDGEVMSNDFNSIQSRIGKKGEMNKIENLHFRAFDLLSISYYEECYELDLVKSAESYRFQELVDFINFYTFGTKTIVVNHDKLQNNNKLLRLEYRFLVTRKEDLLKIYKDHCDRHEEGIIIKLYDGHYEFGGRSNWFKVKPIIENTLKVIGYEEGRGKHKGQVGALIISSKNGIVTGKVGSGINDATRSKLNELRDSNKLEGLIVDIAYNEITKNKSGKNSFRFPRLLRIPFDKFEADEIEV